jgi:CSLREA domain-containing protein
MSSRIAVRLIRLWIIVMVSLVPLRPLGAQDGPLVEPRGPVQAGTSVGVAATFTVNSTTDAVDASIGNGVCATAGAVCTLRAAIQEANFTGAPDTIILPAGTYTLNLAGVNEDVAATGDLDILNDLTIMGVGLGSTIINAAGIDRVFDIYNPADVILQSLQIRNGRAASGGSFGNFGGGLITDGGITVTLQSVRVFSNTATTGGGIYNFAGSPTFGANLIVQDSSVSNNTSTGNGAGIANFYQLTVIDSGFANNGTSVGSGGAISNLTGAVLTMTGSYMELNQAGQNAGGLQNDGVAHVMNSQIADNTTDGTGGGVTNIGGTLAMTNTTLSNNIASLAGGGLSGNGLSTLNNVTVYSNTAPVGQGGGIWDGGSTLLSNSLVASNTGGNCNRTLISTGNNLDSANTCGFTIGLGDQINTNPLLDPILRRNGGGVAYTHALLPGSPAIDRGNNLTCPPTDQRGVARVDGDRNGSVVCDIGAFEFDFIKVFMPLVIKSP